MNRRLYLRIVLAGVVTALAPAVYAQPPAGRGGGPPAPQVTSPEVQADRRVVFRILAPKAQDVRLNAGDLPGERAAAKLTKGENGVWELTLGPVDPGAYRYTFNVDGVAVVDPRNPSISESNNNVWSLVYVPGSDFIDTKQTCRTARWPPCTTTRRRSGASAACTSTRRPAMRSASRNIPVFYLLHGAGDSDDSWTSVGRAGFILDNLIAAKKAKPMIVVMPAGHTTVGPAPRPRAGRRPTRRVRGRLHHRRDAVRREELSRADGSRAPRHRRASRWAATRRSARHPALAIRLRRRL